MPKIILHDNNPDWGGITLEDLLEYNLDLMARPFEFNRHGGYLGQPYVKCWGIYRHEELVGKWYPGIANNPRGQWKSLDNK